MKKEIVYMCISVAVLILCFGIFRQREVDLKEEDKMSSHTETDTLNISDMPVLKFVNTKYDFGTFKTEKKRPINVIDIDYGFQNVGKAPLVIYKVDVSCTCLSVDFPQEPIKQKENGIIKIKVNTKGITGAFNKTLFVRSNATEDVILLRIVGRIK